jgi:hypothetical protein
MPPITSKVEGFDLPQSWHSKRIKYVATYNVETLSDDTDDFIEIEYIEISGVSLVAGVEATSALQFHAAPSRARRVVKSGDTLVSTVRTYLKAIAMVREAPDNLIASTGSCVIRPGDELDAGFLGWAMKSEPIVGEIVARSVGVSYGLTSHGGYVRRAPSDFNEDLCLFPADVVGFLKDTQAQKWDQLETLLKGQTEAQVLSDLTKELTTKGTLHVLRHGFRCYGKTLRLAFFRPNTAINPETADLYAKNRLTITRQVAFTSVMKKPGGGGNRRCILDVTLAVNGLARELYERIRAARRH